MDGVTDSLPPYMYPRINDLFRGWGVVLVVPDSKVAASSRLLRPGVVIHGRNNVHPEPDDGVGLWDVNNAAMCLCAQITTTVREAATG